MKKNILGLVLGLMCLACALLWSATFTVSETEQAIVTMFGRPRRIIVDSGLHVKWPLFEDVNTIDKRILSWDGHRNQIPSRGKKYLWVDTTARWRIVDSLEFFTSVGNIDSAKRRLDDLIDSATRDVVGGSELGEIVRNTNAITDSATIAVDREESARAVSQMERIRTGRRGLERAIKESAAEMVKEFGIQLIDVSIKRVNYEGSVQKKVFERMISERLRIAARFRSEGRGRQAAIEGEMDKELSKIRSEAHRRAAVIMGEADANAADLLGRMVAEAPEFYRFWRSLTLYESSFAGDRTLLLSTDSPYYKYITDGGRRVRRTP